MSMRSTYAFSKLCGCVGLAAALAACESGGPGGSAAPRSTLSLDSFSASPGAVNGAAVFDPAAPGDTANPPVEDQGATAPVEIVTDAPPPPVPGPARTLTPGSEVVLDSLVGQINGRPVFADAFFAPIDAKLRLAAEQNSLLQFEQILALEIAQHLRDILESELILAQAQSQLNEQQQMGLFAFLEQQQSQFVLETGGGSAEEARRRLLEERGITMEDFMEQERQRALIQLILQQEIAPRIVISWKDIEREYAEQYAKYNPPAQARILKIWIDIAQHPDLVQQVTDRLDQGEPFQAVWEDVQPGFRTDDTYLIPTGALADIELIPLYKEQLAPLSVGDTTRPFQHELTSGPRMVWLHVAEINQPSGRLIYDQDVQLELRQNIFNRRFGEERMRHMEEQLGPEVMQDIGEMAERLEDIGAQRYLR